MSVFKRILIATDFGDAAGQALTVGCNLARTFGSHVMLLHVVEDIAAHFGAPEYSSAIGKIQSDLEESARGRILEMLTQTDLRGLDAETAVLTSTPAPAIVNFARDQQADLIVMGTHGRGKVARLFLGSVAERVARTAPCPVTGIDTSVSLLSASLASTHSRRIAAMADSTDRSVSSRLSNASGSAARTCSKTTSSKSMPPSRSSPSGRPSRLNPVASLYTMAA